jgi:hypothetical protein
MNIGEVTYSNDNDNRDSSATYALSNCTTTLVAPLNFVKQSL